MKEKLFKFKISNVEYGLCMRDELNAIRQMIGDYEVVKTRQCIIPTDRIIWCKKKDDINKKIVDEIKKVFDDNMFPEDREEYIYEIMKRYGKLD